MLFEVGFNLKANSIRRLNSARKIQHKMKIHVIEGLNFQSKLKSILTLTKRLYLLRHFEFGFLLINVLIIYSNLL